VTVDLKALLRSEAAAAGFDVVRVTPAELDPMAAPRLRDFLDNGRHGDMDWMATHADRRAKPSALWPQARSAIMLAISYAPPNDPIASGVAPTSGVVSVYARGRDYHDIVKKGLKRVARAFALASGAQVKVFVDTAPLMEKPLAASAGVGWQGKHTNLVSRDHGSWLFLGAVLTDAELVPDLAEADHCGSCRRCLDVCPTKAFPAPYQLDARRCIAYLTIEHKGHIATEFRQAIGNRIFGCDDCLAVCPWNKFAASAREMRFLGSDDTATPPLRDLLAMDDAAFRNRFRGTPVKRTGWARFMRNVLIAAGNAADPSLAPAVASHLASSNGLVRAMAAWAAAQVMDRESFDAHARTRLAVETDQDVREEWRRAMTS
jgi:epoxyqueuosine reductase